jgi:type IV pilus assembly protein PilB
MERAMPDDPQNNEDEFEEDDPEDADAFEDDDDSIEFELNLPGSSDSDVDLVRKAADEDDFASPPNDSGEFELDLSADEKDDADSDIDLVRKASDERDPAPTPSDSGENDAVPKPNDFTDILIRRGVIEPRQILEAKSLQHQTGGKLHDVIVKLGLATAQEVMSAIAEFHGLQFIDLTEMTIPQAVVELVPEEIARENVVLPLSHENGILKIIMSSPPDSDTVQKLQFICNKEIQPVCASHDQIVEAINRHYGQLGTESADSMLQEFTDTAIEFHESPAEAAAADESDSPVVKLVHLIIQEAISLRASDIHIEPLSDRVRIRDRIDGVLVERNSPPLRLLAPILSRVKIMANIKVSEHRQPQQGRFKLNIEGTHFDLRVSILPTQHGESAVLRIAHRISIGELGLDQDDLQRFRQIIGRTNGLFLVTGPVGSGKTTSLYAALEHLNRPDRKIIAVEEPVEYALPGIAQCQIPHDLTSASALRAILGQRPHVVVVGEIRDHETAQIAVQAALGGCLVLGALHNPNDAPSAITRLAELGVQPFLIASSLIAVMAQRLVRVVCPRCKDADEPEKAEITAAGITPDEPRQGEFMRGRGCNYCFHTGYRGRTALFELFQINGAFREMTFNQASTREIRRKARSLGMRTLLEDGVNKALKGITTLEEVLSTCPRERETDEAAS